MAFLVVASLGYQEAGLPLPASWSSLFEARWRALVFCTGI